MKTIAIALCSLAVAAPAAFAQDNSDRNYPYDPYLVERQQWREAQRYDRDYRFRDDRFNDYRFRDDRARDDRARDDRFRDNRVNAWADFARRGGIECWNPRARHFEDVRPGRFQDDLDYGRCRQERFYGGR